MEQINFVNQPTRMDTRNNENTSKIFSRLLSPRLFLMAPLPHGASSSWRRSAVASFSTRGISAGVFFRVRNAVIGVVLFLLDENILINRHATLGHTCEL